MTTYYVDPAGSDAADGLSPGTAWATLAKAIATMSAAGGHVVNMAAGTYNEDNGSGYLIWQVNYAAEVRIVGSGVGSTIIRGVGSSYTFRVNALGLSNVTFEELTILPLGSRSAFIFSGAGTSNNIKFKNAKIEAAGGSLGSTRGMVELNSAHTLNGLTFDNTEIDTDAATNGNALMLNGDLDGLTVINGSNFHGVGNVSFIRIDEARGSHFWGGDCSVSVSNASMGIWYTATASGDLELEFESGFESSSSGDDAAIIVGGTSGNNVPSVTVGDCVFDGGNGGLRIDSYVDAVSISGGTFTSSGTSPGLSVQSDGVSGAIGEATVTGVTASSTNGHGALFGVDLVDLVLTGGNFDGSDHSLVAKANGTSIIDATCESATGASLLVKGGRSLTIQGNTLNNSATGGFCLDLRDDDPIPADNLVITGNILNATGSAKALNVSASGTGDNIIERDNYVIGNQTAEILGTSAADLTEWPGAYTSASYPVSGNGVEFSSLSNVTLLDPSELKPGLTEGANLNPSMVRGGYAGGTPTSADDLKPTLVGADGNLKPSLVTPSGELKPGFKKNSS